MPFSGGGPGFCVYVRTTFPLEVSFKITGRFASAPVVLLLSANTLPWMLCGWGACAEASCNDAAKRNIIRRIFKYFKPNFCFFEICFWVSILSGFKSILAPHKLLRLCQGQAVCTASALQVSSFQSHMCHTCRAAPY